MAAAGPGTRSATLPTTFPGMLEWEKWQLEEAERELDEAVAAAKEGRDAAVLERLTDLTFAAQEDPKHYEGQPGGYWDCPEFFHKDDPDPLKDKAKIRIIVQVTAWYLSGAKPKIPDSCKYPTRVGSRKIPAVGRVLHGRLEDVPQIIFRELGETGCIEKSGDEKTLAMVRGALAFKQAGT